eukprot:scaffold5529_cov117-Cylindrotheca_fusiformis.AAC.25
MGNSQDIDILTDQVAGLEVAEKEDIEVLADWIQSGKAKRITVLSGAGVSVAAGIPDFRTPGTGLYSNLEKYNLPYPEAVFDVSYYRKNPQPFCTLAKELWPGLQHSPTLTHSFLKLLSSKGLLLRNYSQNIDGLEFLAGIPAEELVNWQVEVDLSHCIATARLWTKRVKISMFSASCIDCGRAADSKKVKDTILAAHVPQCSFCSGKVKPDIVFFGESLPDRFHRLLSQDMKETDLLLIMGTSLQVAPVSMIPNQVKCSRVLFNREKVMKFESGDVFIEGNCDDNVEKLCSLLNWTEELTEMNLKTRFNEEAVHLTDELGESSLYRLEQEQEY